VGETLEILLPFHGEHVFLFIVALLAGYGNIALGAFAAPDNGNDVIHRQLIRRETATAIVADPPGEPLLPPPRIAQSPGLLSFSVYLLFAHRNYKRWFHSSLVYPKESNHRVHKDHKESRK
jgi:hypothetical protein